ncbi:tetratricopeptide repeat protein [uncultured Kordia sp.]|uniref:tetratricopeptide repeat protein n=1 Tax=uncultured Kordia sp. TaxID=507699 RepID=UPI00260BBBEF|nr:tetratricopeptide repeat protein [uncultured Kordia sp.]
MKKVILILSIMLLHACKDQPKEQAETTQKAVMLADNEELKEIYKQDQASRKVDNIDWKVVSKNDSLHRVRVRELLAENKVNTSLDYHNAAMIFQHGRDSTDYGMAVRLMQKSVDLDSTADKWLLAAATDRYLLSKNEPQIYGTQYERQQGELWKLSKMDTTKITDDVRLEYGVQTLAEQRERVKKMNSKQLSELTASGKSIVEIITFIKNEDLKASKYDLSESGINVFGYSIMTSGNTKDALAIFKLNTELYPSGFNTFDSYGECFLALGDTINAIKNYQKSLDLNPENTNATNILSEIKK